MSYNMTSCHEAFSPRPLGQRQFDKVLERCPLAHVSFKPLNPSYPRPSVFVLYKKEILGLKILLFLVLEP